MRAVVQRVSKARVSIQSQEVSSIQLGLLVLLGVEVGDTQRDVSYLSEKTAGLRIFCDEQGLMNRSVIDAQGSVLVVSQFTLLGDVRRGRRPSFVQAAEPVHANQLYQAYCDGLAERGLQVGQGVFQADMQVELVNDGPVTILLDSRKFF